MATVLNRRAVPDWTVVTGPTPETVQMATATISPRRGGQAAPIHIALEPMAVPAAELTVHSIINLLTRLPYQATMAQRVGPGLWTPDLRGAAVDTRLKRATHPPLRSWTAEMVTMGTIPTLETKEQAARPLWDNTLTASGPFCQGTLARREDLVRVAELAARLVALIPPPPSKCPLVLEHTLEIAINWGPRAAALEPAAVGAQVEPVVRQVASALLRSLPTPLLDLRSLLPSS
jgi:hypothetical protein